MKTPEDLDWFSSAKELLIKWKAREQAARESAKMFTPRSQQVLKSARMEAELLNDNFVGTEHILLGLIALNQGVAATILIKKGLVLEVVRKEIGKIHDRNSRSLEFKPIPYTPRARKVIKQAEKEAKVFNHTFLGTEHLLLALLSESEGPAHRIFKAFGLDPGQTRKEIQRELNPNFNESEDSGKC